MQKKEVQHVFLVGAKSLGAYGGYETFVNKLTEYHQNNCRIKYHVACKANGDGSMNPYETTESEILNDNEFIYHNAHCFRIKIPQKIGAAQAIYYDVVALKKCCEIIKKERIEHPVIYIMACRIGPFVKYFYKEIHKLGGKIFLNPDGHEWMRTKWPALVRVYWKVSEGVMVKYSDLVVCDSKNIKKYIIKRYSGKVYGLRTTYIAYGADIRKSRLEDDAQEYLEWLRSKGLRPHEYYLVVGRFVPENNYETMIREFMKSHSTHDFVIITNLNDKFMEKLERKLKFRRDKRVKFVGAVYDQELLKKIRENAYGYLHGHEVGGTNPSLLEALASTDLNLLLDVGFNREVAKDGALYWTKKEGELAQLIDNTDKMGRNELAEYARRARMRIESRFDWEEIVKKYQDLFLDGIRYSGT